MDIEYGSADGWSDAEDKLHLTPVVRVGNTIHISGTTGRSSSQNPEEQFVAAFKDVSDALSAVGAGWDDVVKLTTYHVGGIHTHLDLLLEVKDRYVKAPYPAWTGVGVTDLANPDALIEIDVIAEARS